MEWSCVIVFQLYDSLHKIVEILSPISYTKLGVGWVWQTPIQVRKLRDCTQSLSTSVRPSWACGELARTLSRGDRMLYLLKFVSISSQQPSTQRSEARGGTQPRPRLPSRLIQHTQFFFSSITGDSKELFRLDKTLSRDIAVSFSTQLSQLIQYKH